MKIALVITALTQEQLAQGVNIADRELINFIVQRWIAAATIDARDELSPYDLQQQLADVPEVKITIQGEAPNNKESDYNYTSEERASNVMKACEVGFGEDFDTVWRWFAEGIREAVTAERKACAQLAERQPTWVEYDSYQAQVQMRVDIAAAIRARTD